MTTYFRLDLQMPTEQKATASLLSGVFKFVSTEFEHFVANATGSALPVRLSFKKNVGPANEGTYANT